MPILRWTLINDSNTISLAQRTQSSPAAAAAAVGRATAAGAGGAPAWPHHGRPTSAGRWPPSPRPARWPRQTPAASPSPPLGAAGTPGLPPPLGSVPSREKTNTVERSGEMETNHQCRFSCGLVRDEWIKKKRRVRWKRRRGKCKGRRKSWVETRRKAGGKGQKKMSEMLKDDCKWEEKRSEQIIKEMRSCQALRCWGISLLSDWLHNVVFLRMKRINTVSLLKLI